MVMVGDKWQVERPFCIWEFVETADVLTFLKRTVWKGGLPCVDIAILGVGKIK